MSFTKKEKEIATLGREHLRTWLIKAEEHGTIYYNVQSVARSGMSRQIVLSTIIEKTGHNQAGPFPVERVSLSRLWPALPEGCKVAAHWTEHNAALDVIAKDWGFSFTHRAFVIGGCGMDMVFALVDNLAGMGGMDPKYANRVNREAF